MTETATEHAITAVGRHIPATHRSLAPDRTPRSRPALTTAAGLLREMAAVYRAVRAGALDSQEGTRRVYILDRMSRVVEGALLEERLARLEARSGTK